MEMIGLSGVIGQRGGETSEGYQYPWQLSVIGLVARRSSMRFHTFQNALAKIRPFCAWGLTILLFNHSPLFKTPIKDSRGLTYTKQVRSHAGGLGGGGDWGWGWVGGGGVRWVRYNTILVNFWLSVLLHGGLRRDFIHSRLRLLIKNCPRMLPTLSAPLSVKTLEYWGWGGGGVNLPRTKNHE